jgi:hypothetical protein
MSAAAVISNSARKFRASVDRTPSGFPKGNANSSYRGKIVAKDQTRAFPFVVFGVEYPYKPEPVENVGGIWFDVRPLSYRGVAKTPGAPKATKAPAKKRTVRTDPGPGRRPSLSSIRAKG